jgi:hypothetical protein
MDDTKGIIPSTMLTDTESKYNSSALRCGKPYGQSELGELILYLCDCIGRYQWGRQRQDGSGRFLPQPGSTRLVNHTISP